MSAGLAVAPDTPARFAAEWEPHEATWIAWPHNTSDWPGKFAPIPWVYGEVVRWLARGETVRILVRSAADEARARRLLARVGAPEARIEFFRVPTDRGWTRDFGACFVRHRSARAGLAIARFRFNAWAKYPQWRKDDAVPPRLARALGLPLLPVTAQGRDVVLEGGAIDGNGAGALLTTEECLLDPAVQVRNPGLSRRDMEKVLAQSLGVTQVIWLGRGIAGDDTHGHVDDLARFVGPRTVVLCREADARDVNYRALEENRERLEGLSLADGSTLEVVSLPMPSPLVFDGRRLPASYANFYASNSAVLVPTFNDPSDRRALGILGELIRDRPVVGIHAVDLLWGLGTLHCMTREQPAA
ncbi:MAG: agmatine deiminase [Acidobacteria bacterium]|nr:MAG: agmatine deiminase [Acidobacteriota bacterium]